VILVTMRHGGFIRLHEDTTVCSELNTFEVALPPDWRTIVKESPSKDEPPLSAKGKAFLARELFPPRFSETDKKLRLAFGDDCPELRSYFKLDVGSRGLVLTADDFHLEPDGRVKLTRCSIALFATGGGGADAPPITTIRSDSAFLKLDRPINWLHELGKRKIVSVEVAGGLHVTVDNPRR